MDMRPHIAGYPSARQRGVALVACLFVLFFLASLALAYGFAVRLELNTARNFRDDLKAQYCAKAGIYRALGELRRVPPSGSFGYPRGDLQDAAEIERVQRYEEVYNNAPIGDGSFTVKFKDNFGQTGLGPMDENSLIDINVLARSKNRDKLRSLFGLATDNPDTITKLVDSVIDYTDHDDSSELEGAEKEDYEALQPPVTIRNGSMRTSDEFLNILTVLKNKYPGEVDESIWFGEDANGNGVLDWNENDGDKTPPADDEDGELDRGIKDYVTVDSGSDRVDVNTASPEVLQIMLPLEEYEIVMQERQTRRLTGSSATFRIRSYGKANGYTHVIEWVVRLGGAGGYPAVLRMYSL